MLQYKFGFIKMYLVEGYLNDAQLDGWVLSQISDPVRTSKSTADPQYRDKEEAGFSVMILMTKPRDDVRV